LWERGHSAHFDVIAVAQRHPARHATYRGDEQRTADRVA
jgi:hypothetical protein